MHITTVSAKIALVMHMNTNFIITDIHRVILVGKEEYPEPRTVFSHNLSTNELIFHFSGNDTVYFNGKTLHTEENTIRFLPAGETREYIVERRAPGECIDIFFNTDVPVSEEAFVLKITNSCNFISEVKNGKMPKSDKSSDGHGFGTKIIENITKKYNGTFTMNYNDGFMTIIAALQCNRCDKI